MREDRDFADVTLACEDGQQVEAHKVILAASSPFFQSLLKRNKHQHPLIYMRGIKSEDLMSILDFLYLGEANVYQENLDNFRAIAEELSLKGLTREGQKTKTEDSAKNSFQNKVCVKNENPPEVTQTKYISTTNTRSPSVQENTVSLTDSTVTVELNNLDDQIKSMMRPGENMIPNGPKALTRTSVCQVCGKEGLGINIKAHIEANHIEGISHSCKLCEKTFR